VAEDVLVIGAGPAGLACAYYLQQANISYKVVDKARVIASTWASLYPSLRLNTTRFFSHMPGMKFPVSYGIFPTGKQYHAYLVKFAQKHKFNIHLGVEVYHIQPENDGWRVESSEGSAWYPVVMMASGRFSNPYTAVIPGLDDFTGIKLHAHDFLNPQDFAGKRMLIVGNGPSGVDIAVALQNIAAKPVYLAIRTAIDLGPRYPWGLPKHAWVMIAEKLPKKWGDWLTERVERIRYRGLEKLGLILPEEGRKSSAAVVRGPELVGKVHVVVAPARFYGRCAELVDGKQLEIDALILATGYRPALQYLSVPYETDEKNRLPLRELPGYEAQGYPGLFVMGVFYQGKGALYNFSVEARTAVEQIKERLTKQQLKIQVV
jgi:cation diffusion facilitator CzcD-associated flavoprotein CzcO